MASKNHGSCQTCNRPIQAGDEYEGYVCVLGKHLHVGKHHLYCPEDWHQEQDEIVREEERRDQQEAEASSSSEAA